MTGPEHYREAEARLEFARQISHPDSDCSDEEVPLLAGLALQSAQAHATLALAAATAYLAIEDMGDWHEVIQP